MRPWIRAAGLFFVLGAPVLLGGPALAQSDTGEITITVVDATTNKPVANARTILIGPTTASSLTTSAGIIHYTDVPVGIYRVRVVRFGYDPGVSKEFDVLAGRAVAVNVGLASSTGGLKVIGSVSARSQVQISSSDISDNSAIRRLSDSLTDALDKLAGVTVTQDSSDPNAAVTVSLNNHDESQTSISLDGIPLAAAGSAANLRQIGTDLFSGSSVSFSPQAGSLGGGVNFRTLQPSQALQLHLNGTYGSYDRGNYSVAATGSIGSLGLAVQHTFRSGNNPLTFQDYLDASGFQYPHEGWSTSDGDFIKARYRLGDERTTISATALSTNNDITSLCTSWVTLVPCGSGPNNSNYGRFGFGYLTVQSLVGTVATTFSAYANSSVQNSDYLDSYVDLVPAPSLSTTDSHTDGVAYSASIAQGRHTFTFSGNTLSALNTSTPKVGSIFETAFTNDVSSYTESFSDAIKSSDRLTLSPQLSLATSTGVGTSLLGGFSANFRPEASDNINGSLSFGSSQPATNPNRSFSDPSVARNNCAANSTIVSGPGDTGSGPQSAFTADVAVTHQFASGATLSADVFSQVQSGQLIQALIAEPASYFPTTVPGDTSGLTYLQQVNAQYHAATVCGAAAPDPTVYVSEPVGGTRRLYQGINLSGRFGAGRDVVIIPTYSINKAELTAASARLLDGPSTTIVGQQLPGRPIHRGGVTIDGLVPQIGTELLANAQYTGSNNNQNIGPYVVVSAGISHAFGPGRVTFFENNIFGTYNAYFAGDAFAQPLALSDGNQLLAAGQPLQPRTLSVNYVVNVGGSPPRASFNPLARAAASGSQVAQASAGASPGPGGAAPGGPGGGGPGIPQRFLPVAPPPGTDPLSLAIGRASCDADAQAEAKPALDALRAYVAAYEAKKTPLPAVAVFEIVPHAASADPTVPYYLELHPKIAPPGGFSGGGQSGGGSAVPGGGPGGPGGPPGGPGGPGGPPGGFGGPPPEGGQSGGSEPTAAQRAAFLNSPNIKTLRGMVACQYLTVFSSSEAKAKGIVTQGGRAGLFYVPNVGLVFVRPPELPQGGGSLKQGS